MWLILLYLIQILMYKVKSRAHVFRVLYCIGQLFVLSKMMNRMMPPKELRMTWVAIPNRMSFFRHTR